jgi:hypothetical protein
MSDRDEPMGTTADAAPDEVVLDELSAVFASERDDDEPAVEHDPEIEDDPAAEEPVEDAPVEDAPVEVERPSALIDPGLLAVAGSGASVDDRPGGEPDTIRIADDDELPDAVYLDDELAREERSDGTVFIDDDETGDAIVASEATARTGIEPRIRQRRIGVRRAEGRRRLQWLLVAAGVLVAVIAVLAVLASSLFSVSDISVVGNRYTDPDALNAVIIDIEGTPTLLVDTADAEARLEEIPWVEDARVTTGFPNSASIEIREREAVAAMPGADGSTRVLDAEGRVLDLIDGQPIALVWISGTSTLDIPAGHFAPPGPTWAAALVPKLTPSIRPRVESIQVTPDGSELRLFLRPANAEPDPATDTEATVPDTTPFFGGPLIEVRFGSALGDNEQIEKLVRLERVLADLGTDRATVIDVSTAEVTVL